MFGEKEDNSTAICPGLELRKVPLSDQRELNSQKKKAEKSFSLQHNASGLWLRREQNQAQGTATFPMKRRTFCTTCRVAKGSKHLVGPPAGGLGCEWAALGTVNAFLFLRGFVPGGLLTAGFCFPGMKCEPDPDLTQASSFGGLVKMSLCSLHPSLGEKGSVLSNTFSLLFGSNNSFLVVQNALILDTVNVWSCVLFKRVSHAKSPPGLASACSSKQLYEGKDSFADFADLLLPFVKIHHTIKNNNLSDWSFQRGLETKFLFWWLWKPVIFMLRINQLMVCLSFSKLIPPVLSVFFWVLWSYTRNCVSHVRRQEQAKQSRNSAWIAPKSCIVLCKCISFQNLPLGYSKHAHTFEVTISK